MTQPPMPGIDLTEITPVLTCFTSTSIHCIQLALSLSSKEGTDSQNPVLEVKYPVQTFHSQHQSTCP